MAVTTTYPGVYIEELPSSVRPITGVATSITAFVGYTSRGIDNRATTLLSFGDFERAFGGLDSESSVTPFSTSSSTAARQPSWCASRSPTASKP